MKPNIVLIEVDQMRGDCVGVRGHPVVETPNLDMMVRDGVLFSNAYSAVPSCIAARAAIMTGMQQTSHGRVGYRDMVKWDYDNYLASSFVRAGYHTQSIGKMHVFPTRSLCGFHNVILHDGYTGYNRSYQQPAEQHWDQTDDYLPWLREKMDFKSDLIDSGLECNSWVGRPWIYSEHLHPTNWVVNQSIDFLRKKDPAKPFFLKMSFVRPHSPLDPPQTYFDMYNQKDLPLPPVGDWADREDKNNNGLYINARRGEIGPEALIRQRAAYYGLITHIDHQIGRFIQKIQEYGELNNTVFLFTSDHGDMLGDHNIFRKALPYEGSSNIPFIIYDPGLNLDCQHDLQLEVPVELRDIMPTLLDIAEIEIPDSVEGMSLKPLLENNNFNWREYIHGEHSYGAESNHYVTDGKQKYIWYSQTGEEQFFDLQKDPKEKNNLLKQKEYQNDIEYFRKKLISQLQNREEGYSDGEKLVVGQQPVSCLSHIF